MLSASIHQECFAQVLRRVRDGMHRTLLERPVWYYNGSFQCLQLFFTFIILKCFVGILFQRYLVVFLRNGLRSWQSCARFGINLRIECTDPKKES